MSAGVWAYLNDNPAPETEGSDPNDDYLGLSFFGNVVVGPRQSVSLGELWRTHRDEVLAEWVESRPGHRPRAWWRFDAPGPARALKDAGEDEPRILADFGLLTDAERTALAQHGVTGP